MWWLINKIKIKIVLYLRKLFFVISRWSRHLVFPPSYSHLFVKNFLKWTKAKVTVYSQSWKLGQLFIKVTSLISFSIRLQVLYAKLFELQLLTNFRLWLWSKLEILLLHLRMFSIHNHWLEKHSKWTWCSLLIQSGLVFSQFKMLLLIGFKKENTNCCKLTQYWKMSKYVHGASRFAKIVKLYWFHWILFL